MKLWPGTSNLLSAAIECGVRYFIHVSTADVVIGEDPVYYGSENTTPIPKKVKRKECISFATR